MSYIKKPSFKRLNLRRLASDPKYLLLVLILFALPLFLNSYIGDTQSIIQARVVSVVDGDTIKVLDSRKKEHKIRFFGIDAPENNQPYGKKAKEFLASKIAGKEVQVLVKDKDKYGRIVAIIRLTGEDINKVMVANGYAWAYSYYSDIYVKEQERAKENKLGLWKSKNPIEPYKWRKTH